MRHFELLEDRTLLNAQALVPAAEFASLRVNAGEYSSDTLLVRFEPAAGCTATGCALRGSDIFAGSQIGAGSELVDRLHQIRLAGGDSVEAALAAYRANPLVAYAEPDYQIALDAAPNDPRFAELWGLHNTGQLGGSPYADIGALKAWESNTGSANTIVALIDSGLDYNHPDIAANRWVNPGEVPADGIDNDGNGFIDDVFGYDFFNGDGDPLDDNGHGTHVAGILGAVGNNAAGVSGVNWNVQIMALKFTDAAGNGSISGAIAALNYAVANGATVSNNSWRGVGPSQALRDAIEHARLAGHIFVAAAGNGGPDLVSDDNDTAPVYPASFDLDNIIAVAATNRDDELAAFSNFGATSVDLGAPGVGILSTVPASGAVSDPSGYRSVSGTSMATAYVTGVVALVRDLHPDWTYTQVIDRVLGTVDPIASLDGRTVSGGRLNAAKALGFDFPFGAGSLLPDAGRAIATGSSGNVYVAGTFYNSTALDGSLLPDFDPSADTFSLGSRGDADVFVAKYSRTGALLWARSMGSLGSDEALAVAVAADGTVYTTGRFSGIADFDPGPDPFLLNTAGFRDDLSELECETTLQAAGFGNLFGSGTCRDSLAAITNDGVGDVFISKLDADGDFLWARNIGASGASGTALAVDPVGNVYATGQFFGQADFDPGAGTALLGSEEIGIGHVFVSKLTPGGSFAWARELGQDSNAHSVDAVLDCGLGLTNCNNTASGIAIDRESGNLFVTGTANFNSGADQFFITAMDGSGRFLWNPPVTQAQVFDPLDPAAVLGSAVSAAVAVDPSGRAYLGGHFFGTVDFDPGAGRTAATSAGSSDIFLLRFDPLTGAFVWVRQVGGIEQERALDVAVDPSGNAYATGFFRGTLDFDPDPDPGTGVFELVSDADSDDVFVLRLDPSGALSRADRLGGDGLDAGAAITVDPFGNVLTTGVFSTTGDFDPDPRSDPLTSNGDVDIFVSKLVQADVAVAPAPLPGPAPAPSPAPPPPSAVLDQLTVFRNGTWLLDLDDSGGAAERAFAFGITTDVPVPGDWNGDGVTDAAVFRNGTWFLDLDGNGGKAEQAFQFGVRGDVPVAGDWDGDGATDAGVFRNGLWFFDLDGAGGPAERAFHYGIRGDVPVTGDWNGDGRTGAAVFRNGRWFFDLDGAGGPAERAFLFGVRGDTPVAGDWDGDGATDAGVFRRGTWFFDTDGRGAAAEAARRFGMRTDNPTTGQWLPLASTASLPSSRTESPATRAGDNVSVRANAVALPLGDPPLIHHEPQNDGDLNTEPPNADSVVPAHAGAEIETAAETADPQTIVDDALLSLMEEWDDLNIALPLV